MTSIPSVSVVAIIAAHNEEDILETVIRDLHAQGVQVYVMDDGSTDSTPAIAERLRGQGVIGVERLEPPLDGAGVFTWQRILERKAALALELSADWFVHHDADEFRESPWPQLRLADAIGRVDALGYNAIDSVRLDFWPVHDREIAGDIRDAFDHYAPPASYDQRQVRIWKRTDTLVDLASTGGHEVRFEGRRVCPDRFILKHYPIRGQRHGERKIFDERLARFSTDERARGWHVQYRCGRARTVLDPRLCFARAIRRGRTAPRPRLDPGARRRARTGPPRSKRRTGGRHAASRD